MLVKCKAKCQSDGCQIKGETKPFHPYKDITCTSKYKQEMFICTDFIFLLEIRSKDIIKRMPSVN